MKKQLLTLFFSFSWDVISLSFKEIINKISTPENGWKDVPLYDRQLWWGNENSQSAYHPTIISDNIRALHKRNIISDKIDIVSPFKKITGNNTHKISFKKTTCFDLSYDIRIFENGTGTCTFSFLLGKNNNDTSLEQILLIQHLATSISNLNGDNRHLQKEKHLTHSFLKVTKSLRDKFPKIRTKTGHIYLAELFSVLLDSFVSLQGVICNGCDQKKVSPSGFTKKLIHAKQNWQNPYVVSIIQVNEESIKHIVKQQDRLTTKEIGAIAVRLTCDNGLNPSDYINSLRREYIYKSLGFYINIGDQKHPNQQPWIKNYSHYDNLFYTYGRRAAVAITHNFESHPSYFAIPSFMNIIEILRSRWHLGTITNLKLDETFEKIAHREDINKIVDEIFSCRVLYGLFLQNPTPYLFDSGAVTEISDTADNVFWLSRISIELENKLNAIDRLVEVKVMKQSIMSFAN